MDQIRLVATDLDGTLVGRNNPYFDCVAFRDEMEKLRRERGVKWVVCTGRSGPMFRKIFRPLYELGLQPDHIVLEDAFIYEVRGRMRFKSFAAWNKTVWQLVERVEEETRRAFREWESFFGKWDFGIDRLVVGRRRMSFFFQSTAAADRALGVLREKAAPYPYLKVEQFAQAVYVGHDVFTKGLALSELTRMLGLRSADVLAIGDGRNDLSFLEPSVSRFVGCPANAKPEVMEFVSQHGGHIAAESCLAGVVEILQAYEKNQVRSTLPEGWERPPPSASSLAEDSAIQGIRRRIIMWICGGLLGVAALVALILRQFGLLPWF